MRGFRIEWRLGWWEVVGMDGGGGVLMLVGKLQGTVRVTTIRWQGSCEMASLIMLSFLHRFLDHCLS